MVNTPSPLIYSSFAAIATPPPPPCPALPPLIVRHLPIMRRHRWQTEVALPAAQSVAQHEGDIGRGNISCFQGGRGSGNRRPRTVSLFKTSATENNKTLAQCCFHDKFVNFQKSPSNITKVSTKRSPLSWYVLCDRRSSPWDFQVAKCLPNHSKTYSNELPYEYILALRSHEATSWQPFVRPDPWLKQNNHLIVAYNDRSYDDR